jgi:hypothetical protein
MHSAFVDGIKVFSPSPEECEALEKTRLRFNCDEYHQPFPSFAVEFPELYSRRLSNDWGDMEPQVSFIADVGQMICGLQFATLINTYSCLPKSSTCTIEDLLPTDEYFPCGDDYEIIPPSGKADIANRLMRVCVNIAMIAADEGYRTSFNQNEMERADRHLKASRKSQDSSRIIRAKAEKSAVATVVSFSRETVIYRRERCPDSEGTCDTGRTLEPHWREGHWASQPHGPNHSLRKRIRRPAVMVNKRLFAGDPASTETKYKFSKGIII